MSRAFALLGSPVSHSVSPVIHRAAFGALGLEATYVAVEVFSGELETAVRAWARGGGGNVTLPYKRRVARLLDRASAEVSSTGSCNCFWWEAEGALAGDNTDVAGFRSAVRELLGENGLGGGRVILLGAGGAARAVLAACVEEGVGRVDLLNRTAERARRMANEVAGSGGLVRTLTEPGESEPPYDLVVQATSLGLQPTDPLPPSAADLGGRAALDLVYARRETRWTREARAAGLPARDGLAMLVYQAVLSIRRWFPGVEPPYEAMRRAAERALGR